MAKVLVDKRIWGSGLFILFLWACASSPVLRMPDSRPPIVKTYRHVTISSRRASYQDTGVHLKKGDRYSIFAEGEVKVGGWGNSPSIRLWARIGTGPQFRAVEGILNTGLYKAKHEGALKLGVLDGGFKENGKALIPQRYTDNSGAFRVDIIVWENDDLAMIESFLEQLAHHNPQHELVANLKNHISQRKCGAAAEIVAQQAFGTDWRATLARFDKAITYCPGYVEAYDKAGAYLYGRGEKEKAKNYLLKAAELGTKDPASYFMLAKMSLEEDDPNEAFRLINTCLEVDHSFQKGIELEKRIMVAANLDGPKILLYEPFKQRGIMIVRQQDLIPVRGVAIDKDGLAWVSVNREEVSADPSGNFQARVAIQAGTNAIVIEAMDGLGNRSELRVTIEGKRSTLPAMNAVRSRSDMSQLYERSHAVVIGIDAYQHWPALEFAVADARAVIRKFEQTQFDEIYPLLNQEATRARILTTLFHELPQKVGPKDRIAFYFAGHGQTEELTDGGKRGHIIPVDAEMKNYIKTGISMDLIKRLARNIPAKHMIFVMDCCYSGLGLNRSAGVSADISDYIRKIASMRVVQIITAGGKGEQVQEKDGHGLFTSHFLKALDGSADYNKDNIVTGTELGAYLRPTVSNASNQAQTPLYGRLEGEGEFLFYVGR